MDPISLGLAFLLQHSDVAVAGAQRLTRPGVVDAAQMKSSFADFSREVLKCYHKTARYQFADVIAKSWPRQDQYGADRSAVVSISYSGISGANYQMVVAVLGRERALRTVVLQDTAVVRYSTKCELEQWKDA